MKNKHVFFGTLVFIGILYTSVNVFGQDKETLSKEEVFNLEKLRLNVERNPDNLKLNQAFIAACGINSTAVVTQYNAWLIKFPNSSIIPFSIGKALSQIESPIAAKFLLKSVAIDTNLSEAWYLLHFDAKIKADSLKSSDYIRKAIKINPQNPHYIIEYAETIKNDTTAFDSLLMGIVKRKPISYEAEIAINLLINTEKNERKKLAYYELFINNIKYDKRLGNFVEDEIIDAYLAKQLLIDPQKALSVAQSWHQDSLIKLAGTLIQVNELLKAQKNEEAYLLIKDTRCPNPLAYSSWLLFKAQIANLANHTQLAYNSLKQYCSKKPDDSGLKAVYYYGAKLGLTNDSIHEEIRNLRKSTAKTATEFSLYNYLTEKKVSLSNYKGKIILLTYWFPGCGPCRLEFPHFENVLKKFSKNEIAYIGINIEPSENASVLPFLKSTGCSFIPLKDIPFRNKGNLDSPGAPANYLIGKNGQIEFSNFQIGEEDESMLTNMINELLNTNQPSSLYKYFIKPSIIV